MKKLKTQIEFDSSFFPKRSPFLMGAGSILNIFGNYYEFNDYQLGIYSDYKAIESDWRAVGTDICNAMEDIKHSHETLFPNSPKLPIPNTIPAIGEAKISSQLKLQFDE